MFFDTLQVLCDEKGIAMSALLDQVGMSRGNIARWKTADKPPKPATLKKLAEALGVDRKRLEGSTEESQEAETETTAHDILDDVDIAFYGEYKELSEDDKAVLRDMVKVMRDRRAKKKQEE